MLMLRLHNVEVQGSRVFVIQAPQLWSFVVEGSKPCLVAILPFHPFSTDRIYETMNYHEQFGEFLSILTHYNENVLYFH